MDKNLPIQFFEKRRVLDLQKTPGGGNGDPPKFVLDGQALAAHSKELDVDVDVLTEAFEAHSSNYHELPMVMVTVINDDAIAKTHRVDVVSLLTSDQQSNVIGVESVISEKAPDNAFDDAHGKEPELHDTRMILSLVTTDALLQNIRKKLQDTQTQAKLISTIKEFRPFEATICGYNPHNNAYRVALHDYDNPDLNRRAQELFRNQCDAFGIEIKNATRYSTDMQLFRVKLDSVEELEHLRRFEGVRYVEEALPIRTPSDFLDGSSMPAIKVPKAGEAYPVVGVLDTGIQRNAYLAPWILPESEEYYEAEYQDKSHGSRVSSVVEYSDELNGTKYASTEGVFLFEAVVLADQKKEVVFPDTLLDNIRDAIQRHRNIKIWSMSVGTDEECRLDTFSEYGMALDNIADENNVLIIKSAGNHTGFMETPPRHLRITKMADSVRALVVGAIAGDHQGCDIANIDEVSPFSRCGPGPQYLIKPEVVAYGGNAGKLPDGRMSLTGIKVIDENGLPNLSAGTSFSTPWIARLAADLSFEINEKFDPLLIKALIIHNASYPIASKISMGKKKRQMGFGMPPSVREILYNDDYESTLILRDSLERGLYIDILEFPFPKSLLGEDGLYRGQVTLTMVSDPILRSAQGPEYCQSDIEVAFGTIDGVEPQDNRKSPGTSPFKPVGTENLMKESLYSAEIFNVLDEGFLPPEQMARERTLLRLGDKWRPIKKYSVNLSEMTKGNREKYLGKDRQWIMRIKGLFREAIQREADETGEEFKQQFCLILTIRDLERKAPVYNEITQQLQEKGFIYSNVPLRSEIREHVHIEEDNRG